jgi:hypothetical protein
MELEDSLPCWPHHSSESFRLPTAAARVRARIWSSGICGGQSGTGAGFLRVLWFPLPIFIPSNSPSSSQPLGAGTIDHSVADVPFGPSLDSTPPSTMRIKKITAIYPYLESDESNPYCPILFS